MKIYLFSANFFEYTIELANEMSSLGTVVLSLPVNRITEKHRSLISEKVLFEPFQLVDYKSIRDNFKMFYSIAKIIRKHNPDVIHLQSHGLKNFWWLLPFTRGKILVNTIHDPSTHSGDVVSTPNPWNNSMINRCTDKVIVHGEILKKETVHNFGFRERCVTVIPHGHLGLYKAWRNETYPKEQQLFLFFGRIWPYKGLNYFIEAANLLSEENKNARFMIAGKGEWGGIPELMSAYRINQGGVYNSIGEIKQVKTMVAIFDAIAADKKNHSRYAIELKERLSFYHHRLMQLYKAEKNKTEYIKHLMKFISFKEKNISLFKRLIKEELLT